MEDEQLELAQMADLVDIEIGRREKRPLCNRCCRPVGVCWCSSLECHRVQTSCRVVILQHPHEEKRCLRTAPILQAALPKSAYVEAKGKRFPFARFPYLEDILCSQNSILMYPGEKAIDLEELPPIGVDQTPYNIIIIDGTWQQAKSIYHNCRHLHNLRQVRLSGKYISEYVIRTQPTEDALSTVETAAIALATLENDRSIYSTLIRPLQLLCHYQMEHGAVPHQSKEHLIVSGLYKKPLGKRTYKKLRKCGAKQEESLSDFMESLAVMGGQDDPVSEDRAFGEGDRSSSEDGEGNVSVDYSSAENRSAGSVCDRSADETPTLFLGEAGGKVDDPSDIR